MLELEQNVLLKVMTCSNNINYFIPDNSIALKKNITKTYSMFGIKILISSCVYF